MSGYAAGLVWRSALDPRLKPLAAVLADHGNDDGEGIRPSVARMAWMLGRQDRGVQEGLKRLSDAGFITCVAHTNGGRGHARHYILHLDRLPIRPPWSEVRKGAVSDTDQPERVHSPTRKGAFPNTETLERVHPTAPDPSFSTEPSVEPSADAPAPAAVLVDQGITVGDVLREHSDRFLTKTTTPDNPQGCRPIYAGQDRGLAKQLAAKIQGGLPALRRSLDAFFGSTSGWWVDRRAYGIPVFIRFFNDAISEAAVSRTNGAPPGTNPRTIRNIERMARLARE